MDKYSSTSLNSPVWIKCDSGFCSSPAHGVLYQKGRDCSYWIQTSVPSSTCEALDRSAISFMETMSFINEEVSWSSMKCEGTWQKQSWTIKRHNTPTSMMKCLCSSQPGFYS